MMDVIDSNNQSELCSKTIIPGYLIHTHEFAIIPQATINFILAPKATGFIANLINLLETDELIALRELTKQANKHPKTNSNSVCNLSLYVNDLPLFLYVKSSEHPEILIVSCYYNGHPIQENALSLIQSPCNIYDALAIGNKPNLNSDEQWANSLITLKEEECIGPPVKTVFNEYYFDDLEKHFVKHAHDTFTN